MKKNVEDKIKNSADNFFFVRELKREKKKSCFCFHYKLGHMGRLLFWLHTQRYVDFHTVFGAIP